MVKKTTILAVMSTLLGFKTMSTVYLDAMQQIADVDVKCLRIETEDYTKYLPKKRMSFSQAQDIAYIVRRKYQDCCNFKYDILFINGHEIILGLQEEAKEHKTIVSLDVVPSLVHQQIIKTSRNPMQKLRSIIAAQVTSSFFRRPFRDVDVFIPMSQWCAERLRQEYKVSPGRIEVFYPPCDLNLWRPNERNEGKLFNLLFVGNDFYRKGGDLVLSFFKNGRLPSRKFRLTIISNDPSLSHIQVPAGVTIKRNIPHAEVVNYFKDANLFVFPTRKEYSGLVVAEAACVGLPIITRDVGALREYIVNDQNGYLMPYDSNENQWLEKVLYLYEHRDVCEKFGNNARRLAEDKFDLIKFKRNIQHLFDE